MTYNILKYNDIFLTPGKWHTTCTDIYQGEKKYDLECAIHGKIGFRG